MNPIDQFVEIASDFPTDKPIIPQAKSGRKLIATIEYELLSSKPDSYNLRFVNDKTIQKYSAMLSKREAK